MSWLLPDRVAQHAAETPDGLAVVDGARRWSWRELSSRADALAAAVAARGVAPGDLVALMLPTSGEAIAALLGVLRAGAVVAPIPAGLTSRERNLALEVLDPTLVIEHDTDLTDDTGTGPGTTPVIASATVDAEAAAVVVLTSGTTARPKAVVLSGRALAASADAWLAALPQATGWAMPLGIGHVAGLGVVWRAVRDGVPVRVLPPGDPTALAHAVRDDPPLSHVSLVPGQLVRLLDAVSDAPPPATVRAMPLGGGPIPVELVERALRAGWPVVPTYGLSEMGSGVTALLTDDARIAPGSAGRPLPGMSITIEHAGVDGIGEIVVSGPSRSSGYLGEPSVEASKPLGTGDLGRLDDAGRLIVVDRRTDRIVRGGENIDPMEVEAVLERHPAVAEAVVVARSDATWGHVPVAAVVLRPGASYPGDAALAAHSRATLAGFKVPVSWTRLDALPRTASGKLRREAVRSLLGGAAAGELARPGGDAIGWRVHGDGPRPMLLLHGTLSTSEQLVRLAAALAAGGSFTVHSIDRRGAGTSRLAEPRPLDAALHLDDIAAYLDARGIERAAIVGISFGGVLALEAAARLPHRVEAVVAYEPPYGPVGDDAVVAWFRQVGADTRAAFEGAGAPAAARTFLRHVAGDEAWDQMPQRTRTFLEREGTGALADAAVAGLDPDALDRIRVPVSLITGGTSQPFYAPIADELARRIPGAARIRLDGLTHTTPITDPGAVADVILAALAAPNTRPATPPTDRHPDALEPAR